MTAIERAAAILEMRAHGSVTRGGSLAPLTSYRLGGSAGVLLEAGSGEDLVGLSEAIAETGVDLLVIGRGSNMLVADAGFDGIAVRLGGGFRWSEVDGTVLRAGAAMPLPALATIAMQHGLTGFEFGVAIPASLGGAIRMNAGAHAHEVSDRCVSAEVFLITEGRTAVIDAVDAGFGYRTSAFPVGSIVTAGTFALAPDDAESITARMEAAKEWRRSTQPINLPNGGSVFKNPPGDHAARLIEEVCGRGTSLGGARISEIHANFIVASDGARASDVYGLMRRIQRSVADATGIMLEPELKLVGDFGEDL